MAEANWGRPGLRIRRTDGASGQEKSMVKFFFGAFCWCCAGRLALLALIAYPVVWLILLPSGFSESPWAAFFH